MSQFKKGQEVFQACLNYAAKGQLSEIRVVSRIVDSCGKKQMTFVEHGKDGVYGKTKYTTVDGIFATVFATPDAAFEFIAAYTEARKDAFTWIVVNEVHDDSTVPASTIRDL